MTLAEQLAIVERVAAIHHKLWREELRIGADARMDGTVMVWARLGNARRAQLILRGDEGDPDARIRRLTMSVVGAAIGETLTPPVPKKSR